MISGTFYTQGEVAEMFGKDRHTIARWIETGRLAAVRLGNVVLIRHEEIDRLKSDMEAN